MCRWIAYRGSPIYLEDLILKPQHSLIEQSRRGLRRAVPPEGQDPDTSYFTNGDGVGVGWYGERGRPGLYRDILPAWHDQNLTDLAEQTRSGLFFAHVRASSGTPVQRTNCHPFRFENWLFQHNGSIRGFGLIKRKIDLLIDPLLYNHMAGSTDTERMFFLALTLGLRDEPHAALCRMVERIEHLGREAGIDDVLAMTVAISDGNRIFAARYSTTRRSPTLFHNRDVQALAEASEGSRLLPDNAVVVLSEPLDALSGHWQEVPEATCLVIDEQGMSTAEFEPGETS
jgi:glutamine amidotransferase